MSSASDEAGGSQRRVVRLLGAPVGALAAAQEWLDDLFRELQLVSLGTQGRELPPRLAVLGDQVRTLIERPRAELYGQLLAAGDRRGTVDLDVELGRRAVADMARTMLLLDELDEHCRAGSLLTAPRSPQVSAALRWLAREIVGQLEVGREPRPFTWPGR